MGEQRAANIGLECLTLSESPCKSIKQRNMIIYNIYSGPVISSLHLQQTGAFGHRESIQTDQVAARAFSVPFAFELVHFMVGYRAPVH